MRPQVTRCPKNRPARPAHPSDRRTALVVMQRSSSGHRASIGPAAARACRASVGSAAGILAARTFAASGFTTACGLGRVACGCRLGVTGRLGSTAARGLAASRGLRRGAFFGGRGLGRAATTNSQSSDPRSRGHHEQLVLQSGIHVLYFLQMTRSRMRSNDAAGPAVASPEVVVRHWSRSSRSTRAVHQRRAHPQQGGTLPQSRWEWEMPPEADRAHALGAAKSGIPDLGDRS
jgi:hypothetical protein